LALGKQVGRETKGGREEMEREEQIEGGMDKKG